MQTKTHKPCGCNGGGDTCHCAARTQAEQRETQDAPQVKPATAQRPNVGHSFGRVEVVNGDGDASPTPAPACTAPTGVTLANTAGITSTHGTRGGLCALMEVSPSSSTNLCRVTERVTEQSGTCPPMFRGSGTELQSVCTGGSTFPYGSTTGTCGSALSPGANQFTDRHSVQVGTSVLHDSTRNPRNLRSCHSICAQEYFPEGNSSQIIGRFRIRYDFARGNDGGRDITVATVTKTAVAAPGRRSGGTRGSRPRGRTTR